jgi:hypothetical protein
VEATYLRLFEAIGKGLGLLQRDLKMIFSGYPLACRSRGDTRDCLRETGDGPKRYSSSVDQFKSERVELPSLRWLAESNEALNHKREHEP